MTMIRGVRRQLLGAPTAGAQDKGNGKDEEKKEGDTIARMQICGFGQGDAIVDAVKKRLTGAEFQHGRRLNLSDDFHFDNHRVQFSFKHRFPNNIGGRP